MTPTAAGGTDIDKENKGGVLHKPVVLGGRKPLGLHAQLARPGKAAPDPAAASGAALRQAPQLAPGHLPLSSTPAPSAAPLKQVKTPLSQPYVQSAAGCIYPSHKDATDADKSVLVPSAHQWPAQPGSQTLVHISPRPQPQRLQLRTSAATCSINSRCACLMNAAVGSHPLWTPMAVQTLADTWHKHLTQFRDSNILMELFDVVQAGEARYTGRAVAPALIQPL